MSHWLPLVSSASLQANEQQAHLPAGWAVAGAALHATLQVFGDMDEAGAFVLPPNITHVVIEVGANARNWLWDETVPASIPGILPNTRVRDQPHVLLIAFEPLLDKYAAYLSMLTHSDSLWPPPPGWSVRDRAIVLPFAVAPSRDASSDKSHRAGTLHVADVDGCSSLRAMDRERISGRWNNTALMRYCGHRARRVRVPTVSLETVVNVWLAGREVSFVKIDAQGFDLEVAQSAGARGASKIRAMKLEVTADECRNGYIGASTCSPTVDGMRNLGFEPIAGVDCKTVRWRNHGCAADVIFERGGRA